jgi:hypothetical protein
MNLLIFSLSAGGGGAAVYGLTGAIGKGIPGTGEIALACVLVIGAIVSACWYAWPQSSWLKHPRHQLRRSLVLRDHVGAIAFGSVLGVGWLTASSTPFMWIGIPASLAAGSPVWGAVYGLSFGLGRASHLLLAYIRAISDPTEVVLKTVSSDAYALRFLGLVACPALAGAAIAALVI